MTKLDANVGLSYIHVHALSSKDSNDAGYTVRKLPNSVVIEVGENARIIVHSREAAALLRLAIVEAINNFDAKSSETH